MGQEVISYAERPILMNHDKSSRSLHDRSFCRAHAQKNP